MAIKNSIFVQANVRDNSAKFQLYHPFCKTFVKISRDMTKPTVSVRQAETQINLGIRPVWSVFAVHMKKPGALTYQLSA